MERVTKHTSTTKKTPKPAIISAGKSLVIKAGRLISDGGQITSNGTAEIDARDEIKLTGMYSCGPLIVIWNFALFTFPFDR